MERLEETGGVGLHSTENGKCRREHPAGIFKHKVNLFSYFIVNFLFQHFEYYATEVTS